eukprot:364504-Chlamydomonas_euryale.AAC.1
MRRPFQNVLQVVCRQVPKHSRLRHRAGSMEWAVRSGRHGWGRVCGRACVWMVVWVRGSVCVYVRMSRRVCGRACEWVCKRVYGCEGRRVCARVEGLWERASTDGLTMTGRYTWPGLKVSACLRVEGEGRSVNTRLWAPTASLPALATRSLHSDAVWPTVLPTAMDGIAARAPRPQDAT